MARNDRRIVYILGIMAMGAAVLALMSHATRATRPVLKPTPATGLMPTPAVQPPPTVATAAPAAPGVAASTNDDSFFTPPDDRPSTAPAASAPPPKPVRRDTSLLDQYMAHYLAEAAQAPAPDTVSTPSPPPEETAAQRVARHLRHR